MGTVYLAYVPEAGQGTMSQQLTRLLTWFPDVPLASVNVRDDPNVGVNEWAHVEYESGGRIVLAQRWWDPDLSHAGSLVPAQNST